MEENRRNKRVSRPTYSFNSLFLPPYFLAKRPSPLYINPTKQFIFRSILRKIGNP